MRMRSPIDAWFAAALLVSVVVAPGMAQGATVYPCRDDKGGTTLQEKPCPPPAPRAAAVAPQLPCPLTGEQRRRAERLEVQFLVRYPTEASHRAAEFADLQSIAARIDGTVARLRELAPEFRHVRNELAFVPPNQMPSPTLQGRVDAVVAQLTALAEILIGLEQQVGDVVARYRCQRSTLGVRWSPDIAPGASACRPACAGG